MKALSLTIQTLWPMLKLFEDIEMDKLTGQKLYARSRGHIKVSALISVCRQCKNDKSYGTTFQFPLTHYQTTNFRLFQT